jgi:hypothetical protein
MDLAVMKIMLIICMDHTNEVYNQIVFQIHEFLYFFHLVILICLKYNANYFRLI